MTALVRGECNTMCFVFSGHSQVLQRSGIEHDYDNSKPARGHIKSHTAQTYKNKSSVIRETFYSLPSNPYTYHCVNVEQWRISTK